MDGAETDRVSNRRPHQLADLGRAADHQLAHAHAAGVGQRGVHRMLDAADLVAFGDRQLQRVVPGRHTRARGVLQRRGHATQDGPHARVNGLAVDQAARWVKQHVADRHRPRRAVLRADVGVNEQLDLATLGSLQRERRNTQRQRRQQQRRAKGGRHRLTRRARARLLDRAHELAAGSHGCAAPGHVDLDRVRIAVAVARIRLDGKQVIPRQLCLQPLEKRRAGPGHVHHRAARGPDERFEPLGARFAVDDGVVRLPSVGHVEHLLVEAQRVHARARLRGQRPDLHREIHVVQHETFRNEDERLRRLQGLQAGQQIAQPAEGLVALAVRGPRELRRFGFDLGAAQFDDAVGTARHHAAFAILDGLQRGAIAAVDGLRFGHGDHVAHPHGRLLLADHARQRDLHPLPIRGERGRRRTEAKTGHSDPIRRREAVDERAGGVGHGAAPAETDVRLIDGDHDEAPARGVLVGAVPFGHEGCSAVRLDDERHPFGRDDTPVLPIDADTKIGGRQVLDRPPAVVDDGDVNRRDFNG